MTRTARSEGLVGCRRCALVWPSGETRCSRCGGALSGRARGGLTEVWVWWGLGVLAYIPAMASPMLETRMLFRTSAETIVGGAWKLASHGSVGVAAVILVASVLIPLAKFAAIAWLALSVGRRRGGTPGLRHRVYHAVELVGRWSMVDVFVVAVLASLVQFQLVATVKPGPAAAAFALSVIFTMLSARSFDSRLIWDLDAAR